MRRHVRELVSAMPRFATVAYSTTIGAARPRMGSAASRYHGRGFEKWRGGGFPATKFAHARRERTTIVATESEAELARSILPDASVREARAMGKRAMAAVVCERFVGDLREWPVRCETTEEYASSLGRPPTVTPVSGNRIRFVRYGELRERTGRPG
jgi:hypothetical protein